MGGHHFIDGRNGNAESPLLHIWSLIRDELASLQDQAPDEFRGQVANPISGSVYVRDTAFAAQIFATEYRRTQDRRWLDRAKAALCALDQMDTYGGLDEPIWNRYGWHFSKGSLATSGMLLDAVWEARNLVDMERPTRDQWQRLCRYLESCRVGPGLFAHNTVKAGNKPAAVQNTTAIALYLLECMSSKIPNSDMPILQERDLVYSTLKRGQRLDGFWPYAYPGITQRIYLYSPSPLRALARSLPVLNKHFCPGGDRSITFGDTVHHCLTLYYLCKSMLLRGSGGCGISVPRNAWKWIQGHLLQTEEAGLSLNFAAEPVPHAPRYCNFRETTSYFLILATLPLLARMGVVGDERREISLRILTHIRGNLLEQEGACPVIKPYEGPIEILRCILPRVGESGAWKGGCLSAVVASECNL
jgi:hypothetical protein